MQNNADVKQVKERFQRIEKILTAAFPNAQIEIIDDSKRHAKHMGRIEKKGAAEAAQETHFAIAITSNRFDGISRLNRQRQVNELLKDEFQTGLHALKLSLTTSNERA